MNEFEGETIRVHLVRIEGKLDVTNERLNSVQTDITELRSVVRAHGDRLGILEAADNIRTGERSGIALSGRLLWAGIGVIGGIGMAIGKMLLGI
jgi:hypothetical protein